MEPSVVAIAGAKGGVGKTTTSLNLGAAFAERGYDVVVVEADVAMANLLDAVQVDMDPYVEPTLHQVLAGDVMATDATYAAPGGIDVLPSGIDLEGFATTDMRRLSPAIGALRTAYDVVVLDTSPGLSQETLYPLAVADATVLVSTLRLAAVRDTEKTAQLTNRVGGSIAGALFVDVGTGRPPSADAIADFLGVTCLGTIPEDAAVPVSQEAGEPTVSYARWSSAAKAYRTAARELEPIIVDRSTAPAPARDAALAADRAATAQSTASTAPREQPGGTASGFVFDDEAGPGAEEDREAAVPGPGVGPSVGDAISELWQTAVLEADGAGGYRGDASGSPAGTRDGRDADEDPDDTAGMF